MRHLRTKTAISLAAALLMGAPTLQATAPTPPSSTAIDDELSLADLLNIKLQTGSFLELDLAKSPLSMTLIERNKIDLAGARDLSELLEIYVPGFQTAVNKWNGKVWMMRGVANDRNTKFIVLVNGHKMNTESRDGFIQEQSMGLLGDVERIEVLRGPAGLVYGSGAIAGIVNIVTRRPTESGTEVRGRAGTYSNMANTSTSLQAMGFGKISEDQSVMATVGWEKSDGMGDGKARMYGHPGWPYPSASKLDPPSVPADGSYGYTPGNWKASTEFNFKGLRLYGRATHQVQDVGAYGIMDPWPNYRGGVKSVQTNINTYQTQINAINAKIKAGTATSVDSFNLVDLNAKMGLLKVWFLPNELIDGKTATPLDTFWSNVEAGTGARREFISDNIMFDASYDINIGENLLKLKAGFDGNTNLTIRRAKYNYRDGAANDGDDFTEETFGERRYTLGATYLWKTLPKIQLAAGVEQRFDDIGDDLSGENRKDEIGPKKVVSDVLYSNTALFTEGWYDVLPNLGVDFGLRWDGHTRTIDNGGTLNGKLAGVYTVTPDHVIKLIFQTSSNNGSADNYEYNRNHFGTNGIPDVTNHFSNPADSTTPIVQGITEDQLHELKPERVYSYELTSTHSLPLGFSLSPSVSYNMIRELFVWSQAMYRVVNVGQYDNMNIDLQADYTSKYLDVGFNHGIQLPVNTEISGPTQTTVVPGYARTRDSLDGSGKPVKNLSNQVIQVARNDYYSKQPDGTFLPVSNSPTTINPVATSVTSDGENFIGMATQTSKLYADVKPLKGLTLHTDMRVFWGLPGRDSTLTLDGMQGYSTAGANTDPITKWNASLHADLPGNWSVGMYVYDILGINSPKFATNTLRWAPYDVNTHELYAVDYRSYAIDFKKSF